MSAQTLPGRFGSIFAKIRSDMRSGPPSQLTGQERRDFWLLSLGQLLAFCGFFSFFQLPLYIKELGGGEMEIGLIMGMTSLASTLLVPWITAMVARVERRRLMLGGLMLVELTTMAVVTTWAPDFYMAALMVIRGFGFAVYMNAAGVYVAQILPPAEKARWIGINFGFNQVAIGLGPLIGEQLIRHVNYPFFFFFATAFTYSGMILILGITQRSSNLPPTPFRPLKTLTTFFGDLASPRYRWPFLCLLMLAGSLGALFNFTATYSQLIGISSGVFFLTYSLTNAASRFFGAGVADRYGRTTVVVPTLLVMGVGILIFSVSRTVPTIMLAAVMIGIGFGLSNPAILALMLDRSPPHMQGMAIGGFHFAYQLGFLSSAPIYGLVAENWGYGPMWWIAAALTFGAIGFYLLPGPKTAEEGRV